MRLKRNLLAVIVLGCLSSLISCTAVNGTRANGQLADEPNEATVKPEDVAITDFVFGPGDIIEVSVYRQKDLDAKIVVPPDGVLILPLIGEISTRGVGLRKLRSELTHRYSEYLVNPLVSLKVEAIRSRKAYVLGEVRTPGLISLDTQVDVVEAIARAGGVTPDGALNSVLVIRGNLKQPRIKKLNVQNALDGGDLTHNFAVQTGDIIFVPRTFIADVTRFFGRFAAIIGPIVAMQQGIAIWPSVEGVLRGDYTSDLRTGDGGGTTIVLPGGSGP